MEKKMSMIELSVRIGSIVGPGVVFVFFATFAPVNSGLGTENLGMAVREPFLANVLVAVAVVLAVGLLGGLLGSLVGLVIGALGLLSAAQTIFTWFFFSPGDLERKYGLGRTVVITPMGTYNPDDPLEGKTLIQYIVQTLRDALRFIVICFKAGTVLGLVVAAAAVVLLAAAGAAAVAQSVVVGLVLLAAAGAVGVYIGSLLLGSIGHWIENWKEAGFRYVVFRTIGVVAGIVLGYVLAKAGTFSADILVFLTFLGLWIGWSLDNVW